MREEGGGNPESETDKGCVLLVIFVNYSAGGTPPGCPSAVGGGIR
jgi:hypothetical protein